MDSRLDVYMEGQLKDILLEIEMPGSYYEKATTAYESMASYLTRAESSLADYEPEIILQGSIKTGTAIKPITDDGSYDVDTVCNLQGLSKLKVSQKELKERVGIEIRGYAASQNMKNKPHDGKRCWTLEYVGEANFHIDVLPTVDDTSSHFARMKQAGIKFDSSDAYLAHTDKRHPNYEIICADWLTTNPQGYAQWFLDAAQYDSYRAQASYDAASIEEIKVYKVKAPLQRYVQILKRHRDIFFEECGNTDRAPRSVIITTLMGKAYETLPKTSWFHDFAEALKLMPSFIMPKANGYELLNPSNALENFLDGWSEADMNAFLAWHQAASHDLTPCAIRKRKWHSSSKREILRNSLGLPKKRGDADLRSQAASKVSGLSHHQQPQWTTTEAVAVSIQAECCRKGGKFKPFKSEYPLSKQMDLRFSAVADNIKDFSVKWQITNDGSEAIRANCLRGDFYEGNISEGRHLRKESTRYLGRHYVECFLIKDEVCYGHSEPFVINICQNV